MTTETSATREEPAGTLFGGPRTRGLLVLMLFLVALGVRVYRIDEPMFDFRGPRQYRYALIARAWYRQDNPAIPAWKQEVARANSGTWGLREPPLIQMIAILAWRITGTERLWIPRLFSALSWLIAGAFLYRLARRITDADAALLATAFFLLLPSSVFASRAFMVDPLMVSLFVIAAFTVVRYFERSTTGRFWTAVAVSAAAVFVKSLYCLIPLTCLWSVLALSRARERGRLRAAVPGMLLYAVLVTAPAVIYLAACLWTGHGETILVARNSFFIPALLVKPHFWVGWLTRISLLVGLPAFVGALIGILFLRPGLPRRTALGLWTGYFFYGLFFTYTTYTHDYYHLLLIPIAAISLGPPAAVLLRHGLGALRSARLRTVCGPVIMVVLMLLAAYSYLYARRTMALEQLTPAERIDPSFFYRVNPDFEKVPRIAREIGDEVGHSLKVLSITALDEYRYYGDFAARLWPSYHALRVTAERGTARLSAAERLDREIDEWSPEYFVTVNPAELEAQPELDTLLKTRYRLVKRTQDYVIYDLRKTGD